jgi:hypothetical protein
MTMKLDDFEKNHRGMAKSIFTTSLKFKEKMYEQEKKIRQLQKQTLKLNSEAEKQSTTEIHNCTSRSYFDNLDSDRQNLMIAEEYMSN